MIVNVNKKKEIHVNIEDCKCKSLFDISDSYHDILSKFAQYISFQDR